MAEKVNNTAPPQIRYDLKIIADLIKPNSKVLDIGCSDGELLDYLKTTKNVDARGFEIVQEKVSKALARGISVIQGDAENDLSFYPDQNFDYAILSQTIQATKKPKELLQEVLRISKFAIVSLPNFAHFRNRIQLLFKGSMPVSKLLPFEWYETPNIHFCSIKDFENLCEELNFTIKDKIFLTSKKPLPAILKHDSIANFFAEYGIFLITKNETSPTLQEEFTLKEKISESLRSRITPEPSSASISTK